MPDSEYLNEITSVYKKCLRVYNVWKNNKRDNR